MLLLRRPVLHLTLISLGDCLGLPRKKTSPPRAVTSSLSGCGSLVVLSPSRICRPGQIAQERWPLFFSVVGNSQEIRLTSYWIKILLFFHFQYQSKQPNKILHEADFLFYTVLHLTGFWVGVKTLTDETPGIQSPDIDNDLSLNQLQRSAQTVRMWSTALFFRLLGSETSARQMGQLMSDSLLPYPNFYLLLISHIIFYRSKKIYSNKQTKNSMQVKTQTI